MLNKLIINLSFFLHNSRRYKMVKKFFSNLLQNSDYRYKKYFDSFMIILILLSVGILVYEVKNPVPQWVDDFDVYMITSIFLLEYLLRLWVYNDFHSGVIKEYRESKFTERPFRLKKALNETFKGKLSYIKSLSSIVDLLAILPAYRPLRVLRIFVLFRVFKLLRYTKSIHQFVEVFANKRFELITLLLLLIFIVVTAGIAIYIFEENHNNNINSLFDAIYWALITITSVGYGDISPVTSEGRVVSMLIIISGIAMISFVTSVIVSAFSEKLSELKEGRIVEELNKNESFTIICGYGQMTRMFLRSSDILEHNYVIIEKDYARVELGIREGYTIIHEDASRYDVISKFNTLHSNITLLALTNSDVANIYITLNAKSLSRNIKVISRASSKIMEKKCKLAGVDYVVLPNMTANRMLLFAITQPVIYRAIYDILTGQHLAHMDEVSTLTHYKLVGKKIEEIEFKRHKLLFIGLESAKEKQFIFNPSSKQEITHGDILLVMGRKVSIEYFKELHKEKSHE